MTLDARTLWNSESPGSRINTSLTTLVSYLWDLSNTRTRAFSISSQTEGSPTEPTPGRTLTILRILFRPLESRDFCNSCPSMSTTSYTLLSRMLGSLFSSVTAFTGLTPCARFVTEVHHIDGKGHDSGVVYSEMQGRENTSGDLMALK